MTDTDNTRKTPQWEGFAYLELCNVSVSHQDRWPWDIEIEPLGIRVGRIAYGTSQKSLEDVRAGIGFRNSEEVSEIVANQEAAFDRLAAAWNACQGIPTEALEAGVAADMLEALQLANDCLSGTEWKGDPRIAPIADAIAKATGGAA